MTKILTIEDDETTAREIVAELSSHGLEVEWRADGDSGWRAALTGRHDAITLDRMLPGMDGLTLMTRLREAGIDTPVLMISALSEVDERVRGLRAGGDDYLTKPFASEELLARLEVLLRRRTPAPAAGSALVWKDLEIDLISRGVRRSGRELKLLPTEFRLLKFLMQNCGQTLTRTMIFESVWGYRFDPGTNLIDVHMARLRRKIDSVGLVPLIHTIRGRGYAFGDRSDDDD